MQLLQDLGKGDVDPWFEFCETILTKLRDEFLNQLNSLPIYKVEKSNLSNKRIVDYIDLRVWFVLLCFPMFFMVSTP